MILFRTATECFLLERCLEKIKEKCGGYGCTWCDRIPVLFAFVGPLLIPYGYDEFNKGAENLYPIITHWRTPSV